jgi:hypothetical protein
MLLSAVLLFDVAAWEATRFSRDDGYAQLVGWMDGHVPHGARVFATTETAAFVLPMFDIRPIASPQDVRAEGVRYVVTSTKQTNDGYASVTPAFVDWVERNGRPLFTFSGRSNGDLVLYELEHNPVWSQLPQHL